MSFQLLDTLFKGHDIGSKSSKGVEEISLDELDRSKLKPENVPLLGRVATYLGMIGGSIILPLAIYGVIVSVLKRESVVYMYSPAGRLCVTGSR